MSIEKKTLLVLGAILLLATILTWLFFFLEKQEDKRIVEEELDNVQVGRFSTLTDLNGNPVDLNSTDGRVRVVGHFASWCPACLSDLQVLDLVSAEFNSDLFDFVAVNRMEPKETIKAYFNEVKFNANGNVRTVIDIKDTHYKSIGGFSMPETVIYGKNGEILNHLRGPLDSVTLKELLNSTIDE